MINVKNKTCEYEICNKQPTYAEKGSKIARFCKDHRDPHMINVKNKTCEYESCNKHPTYAERGSKNARFCKDHKDPNMIDVISKRCEYENCNKQPTYAERGSKNARFCKYHKDPHMIDVKNKTCDYKDCETRACYGFPNMKASSCARHRSVGMLYYPKKTCSILNCKHIGTHGKIDGEKKCCVRYCEEHAPSDYINIMQRNCVSCGLLDILRGGLCRDCDPITRNVYEHAKENRIRDVLVSRGFEFVSHDKMIYGGECTRYRPDFVFDAGTHFVLLEVDENQHMSYTCDCEQQRMVNISQSIGMATIFVRYNPDGYKVPTGIKQFTARAREDVLIKWLTYLIKPEACPITRGSYCDVLYLFYDGFNNDTEKLLTLT
jgi:hypothetical protein